MPSALPKNLVTKLRISAHQLYVETGKYCNPAISSENRFCFHCKNIVEYEKHFLLDCPLNKVLMSEKSIQNYLILIS